MFLLYYTSKNSEGYYLVYAKSEEEAIEKLKNKLFYMDQLYIENFTI